MKLSTEVECLVFLLTVYEESAKKIGYPNPPSLFFLPRICKN